MSIYKNLRNPSTQEFFNTGTPKSATATSEAQEATTRAQSGIVETPTPENPTGDGGTCFPLAAIIPIAFLAWAKHHKLF